MLLKCVVPSQPQFLRSLRMGLQQLRRANEGGFTPFSVGQQMVIERREVVEPGSIALMVPHRAGDTVPRTQWNAQGRVLTVNHGHGQVECIRCERRASDVQTPLLLERP